MMRRTFLALTLAASLGLAAAAPGETEDTPLTVTDAFARETIGLGKTGAAFLTVSNAGSEDDTLLAGATLVAQAQDMVVYHIEIGLLFVCLAVLVPLTGRQYRQEYSSEIRFGLGEMPG